MAASVEQSQALVRDPASAAASSTEKPVSHLHVPALDGMRGVAVLLVLAFHFGIGAGASGLTYLPIKATRIGWVGVDLFFVLSGFLITGILYDDRKSKHYFKNFYARRVLRIFPLYYLALAVVALLIAVWPPLKESQTDGFIWPALYLSNVVIAAKDWYAIPEILSHYWSLSVEEHFYLLWPFVVYFLNSRRALMIVTAVLAGAALALRTALVLLEVEPTAIFVSTPTRLDALAIGGFFSLAARGPGGAAAILRPAAAVLVAGALTVLLVIALRRTVDEYDPFLQTLGYSSFALGSGGAMIVGTAWRPAKNLLHSGLLRWFGRYSYGLYVWHYPIYFLFYENTALRRLFGVTSRASAAAYLCLAIGITLVVAVISYHAFEKQFLKLKTRFPREA